jgi:DNA-binding MarR family transcriptional regulator
VSPSRRSDQSPGRRFSDEDYQSILTFRTRLRRFLAWSGAQARAVGLTPAQHQLLLAVRGHPDPRGPTIGDIAGYLQLRHHSAVGLVDRAESAGLVRRRDDASDRRLARVQLQPAGEAALEHLTALHVAELRALAEGLSLPEMPQVAEGGNTGEADGAAG